MNSDGVGRAGRLQLRHVVARPLRRDPGHPRRCHLSPETVDLVRVDAVGAQPPQAVVDPGQDRLAREPTAVERSLIG
ncbi:hypothetical protein GCM10022223_56730 [Kineosporia mesophila]|uniref:Uncharacterized protein n=1 Tax=Kineosporia mesophila TaxID=566012 RepID=A0ABP7AFI6_9ACTN